MSKLSKVLELVVLHYGSTTLLLRLCQLNSDIRCVFLQEHYWKLLFQRQIKTDNDIQSVFISGKQSIQVDYMKLTLALHSFTNQTSLTDNSYKQFEIIIGLVENKALRRFIDHHLDQLQNQWAAIQDQPIPMILEGNVDISYQNLAFFPVFLSSLDIQDNKLTNLSLEGNLISSITPLLGLLTNLTHLNLSNNQIKVLPNSIGYLTLLVELNLSNNQLERIPDSITKLTKLEILLLDENQLTQLPTDIGVLTSLEGLYINENSLINLPTSIGQLNQLTELYVSNNMLDNIPTSLFNLSKLNTLNLSNNEIKEINFKDNNLKSLMILILTFNQLKELDTIQYIPSLIRISAGFNQILEFPLKCLDLPNLHVLDLSHNLMDQLPNVPSRIQFNSAGNPANLHVESFRVM